MEQATLNESEVIKIRKEKLEKLRVKGQPFPNDFRRENYSKDILEKYSELSNDDLEQKNIIVTIAGRIKFKRLMGKAAFLQIQDYKGSIQLYVRKDNIDTDFEEFKQWDLGDIIGATGPLFKTKTGELSVKVSKLVLLVKSLRPLPDKYHGLADTELRYRQRYLDLIVNEKSRNTFLIRSKIISSIREYFHAKDFIEVETPMMQILPGGAAAKPFITHHNALDIDLYLRIAPELYLKRLVIGGFERVFELNRNFRNEGISTTHNPEFTMLEFYMAYVDYQELMNLTEDLFINLCKITQDNLQLTYQGHSIDLGKKFTRITLKDAVLKYNSKLNESDYHDIKKLSTFVKGLEIAIQEDMSLGQVQYVLFEKTVEAKLMDPIFITEFPIEVSPLARKNDQNPDVTDRFELFICGKEIANGFSELNDPIDQANRFKEQSKAREKGDDEAMYYDEDYVKALEYGLPPTAGEGIGIDRLVMIFTDSPTIKDVLLFPHLKSK